VMHITEDIGSKEKEKISQSYSDKNWNIYQTKKVF